MWVLFLLVRHTCAYLACKVDEFNVSIMQFVSNMKGDREQAADLILSQELFLMQQLHYHLTIHHPYRPLEGLFIDIKVIHNPYRPLEGLFIDIKVI